MELFPDTQNQKQSFIEARMANIPIRHINEIQKESNLFGISIRDIRELLNEKDMIQDLHRHDFYYILFLKNGSGSHQIDFKPYVVQNQRSLFGRSLCSVRLFQSGSPELVSGSP